jgi:hypothetical protein
MEQAAQGERNPDWNLFQDITSAGRACRQQAWLYTCFTPARTENGAIRMTFTLLFSVAHDSMM